MKDELFLPISEVYGRGWKTGIALWPLFLVRFVFIVLNFMSMIFCLALALGPLLGQLFNFFKDTDPDDYQQVFKNFDFRPFLQKPDFIWTALVLLLIYLVWWFLFEVFFTGALFKQIEEYRQKGSTFSLVNFLKGGLFFFPSMLGLGFLFIFSGLIFGAILILITVVIGVFLKGIGLVVMGFLLILPFLAAGVFMALGFHVYFLMSAAYLVKDGGVFRGLKSSIHKCLEHYGRVVWSILLILLAYLIFSIAYQTVFNLLRHTPFIGFLFLLLELLINLTMATMVWVYFPALSIEFAHEGES